MPEVVPAAAGVPDNWPEAILNAAQLGRFGHGLDLPSPAKDAFTTAQLSMLPESMRDRMRIHFCGPTGANAVNAVHAVVVVTHVDVPPPKKDECIAALKTLVADSRKEGGSVRFEVFQQSNRPNHFSVVEVWKDQRAYDAHITAASTKKFRDQLTPMSGALYDERLYKAI